MIVQSIRCLQECDPILATFRIQARLYPGVSLPMVKCERWLGLTPLRQNPAEGFKDLAESLIADCSPGVLNVHEGERLRVPLAMREAWRKKA